MRCVRRCDAAARSHGAALAKRLHGRGDGMPVPTIHRVLVQRTPQGRRRALDRQSVEAPERRIRRSGGGADGDPDAANAGQREPRRHFAHGGRIRARIAGFRRTVVARAARLAEARREKAVSNGVLPSRTDGRRRCVFVVPVRAIVQRRVRLEDRERLREASTSRGRNHRRRPPQRTVLHVGVRVQGDGVALFERRQAVQGQVAERVLAPGGGRVRRCADVALLRPSRVLHIGKNGHGNSEPLDTNLQHFVVGETSAQ